MTQYENITSLNAHLEESDAPEYCTFQEPDEYENRMRKIKAIQENDCKLLSTFPKYINAEGKIIKLEF